MEDLLEKVREFSHQWQAQDGDLRLQAHELELILSAEEEEEEESVWAPPRLDEEWGLKLERELKKESQRFS